LYYELTEMVQKTESFISHNKAICYERLNG